VAGAITSSTAAVDVAQIDGRFWVTETHTDTAGGQHVFQYLATAGFDYNTALANRAAALVIAIPQAEIAANILAVENLGSLATPTFVFSTPAANVAALRAAYQTATHLQAIMMGDFLSSLTDAQLETAFSLTAGQVATLRTNKLTPAANAAAAIRAGAGQ
jgi:hypothetical protein